MLDDDRLTASLGLPRAGGLPRPSQNGAGRSQRGWTGRSSQWFGRARHRPVARGSPHRGQGRQLRIGIRIRPGRGGNRAGIRRRKWSWNSETGIGLRPGMRDRRQRFRIRGRFGLLGRVQSWVLGWVLGKRVRVVLSARVACGLGRAAQVSFPRNETDFPTPL